MCCKMKQFCKILQSYCSTHLLYLIAHETTHQGLMYSTAAECSFSVAQLNSDITSNQAKRRLFSEKTANEKQH